MVRKSRPKLSVGQRMKAWRHTFLRARVRSGAQETRCYVCLVPRSIYDIDKHFPHQYATVTRERVCFVFVSSVFCVCLGNRDYC